MVLKPKVGDYITPIYNQWLTLTFGVLYKIIRIEGRLIIIDNPINPTWTFSPNLFKVIPGTELGKILYE